MVLFKKSLLGIIILQYITNYNYLLDFSIHSEVPIKRNYFAYTIPNLKSLSICSFTNFHNCFWTTGKRKMAFLYEWRHRIIKTNKKNLWRKKKWDF